MSLQKTKAKFESNNMRSHRTVIQISLWIFLNTLFVFGQQSGLFSDQKAFISSKTKKLSHYYEVLIRDVLTKYYDDRTFLVDTRVSLSLKTTLPTQGEIAEIEALPGLPILPDELRSDGPVSTPGGVTYDIKNLSVDVLIDTSYTEKDKAFISKLITMAANLNEYRGDRLTIRNAVFPVHKNAGLNDFSLPAELTSEKNTTASTIKSDNPFSPLIENLASLIPLLIICVFVLLVVIIIMRSLGKQKASDDETYTTIMQELTELRSSLPTGGPAKPDEAALNKIKEQKSFVLNAFIGNSGVSINVLSHWISSDHQNGIANAAQLIQCVDERIFNIIAPELEKPLVKQIGEQLSHLTSVPDETAAQVLKAFNTDFHRLSSTLPDENGYKDMFGFLKQLSNQQILHLIKEESEGIIGMVLAQLSPVVASQILQRLDRNKRSKILASMGKIENIPLGAYKELAERLSSKALEVVKMKYVTADGLESILSLLDNLPLAQQNEYISGLAETDIHLVEKLKETFITLPEVPSLPDKFLATVVRGMSQDVLIRALALADDGLKDKILRLVPERMQLMIQSGIETMTDLLPVEAEEAQKELLLKIRSELKTLGGRPE